MFLRLVASVAACLDRESARKLVGLRIDDDILKRYLELEEQEPKLTPDARIEFAMLTHGQNFIAALQKEARARLRRPAGSKRTSRKH